MSDRFTTAFYSTKIDKLEKLIASQNATIERLSALQAFQAQTTTAVLAALADMARGNIRMCRLPDDTNYLDIAGYIEDVRGAEGVVMFFEALRTYLAEKEVVSAIQSAGTSQERVFGGDYTA